MQIKSLVLCAGAQAQEVQTAGSRPAQGPAPLTKPVAVQYRGFVPVTEGHGVLHCDYYVMFVQASGHVPGAKKLAKTDGAPELPTNFPQLGNGSLPAHGSGFVT